MGPYFIYCPSLIVYRDIAFNNDGESKYKDTGISMCECKMYQQNKECLNRGRCVVAREKDTWKMISKKSFKK